MEDFNGISVSCVDNSGILIITPVNEFIFSIEELKWIYSNDVVKDLLDKN